MSLNWIVEGIPRPYEVRPSRTARPLDPLLRAKQAQRVRNDDDHPGPNVLRKARRVYAEAEDQTSDRRPAVTATHIMTTPVLTLPRDAPLREALELMRARTIRHVPVTGAAGALVGMVSDRDLPRIVALEEEGGQGASPAGEGARPDGPDGAAPIIGPVEQRAAPPRRLDARLDAVMSTRLLTALPDTPIREVAQVMLDERVSCIPVLDADGQLVGIITSTDILRAVITRSPLELWV